MWDQWANKVCSLRKPLKASQDAPSATHAEFRKAITIAEEIESLSLEDIKIDADRLPEVEQFQSYIDAIYHCFTRKGINRLLNPFANLT